MKPHIPFACTLVLVSCVTNAHHAYADSVDPSDAGVGSDIGGCVESIPKGAERPAIRDVFPRSGTSGWAAALSVTISHGKGEHVLPAGFDLGAAVEAKKLLKKAGFTIPDQDGGAAARVFTDPEDKNSARVTTHIELPLVLLPETPGRSSLELPALPFAVARANGEIATVCSSPHRINVEDPTSNTPEAMPKGNPPPRPQREEWTALKRALLWGGLGLLAGSLLAYLVVRQRRKPKPIPPPPPPRPPWETAFAALHAVRNAGLLDGQRHPEYFDRVSDAVRSYLGARFGFDGLESTTDEILTTLDKLGRQNQATPVPLDEIRRFLGQCDLVKFANLWPSPEQCTSALLAGEHIVRSTMPSVHPRADQSADGELS